jgi:hypothetical protein
MSYDYQAQRSHVFTEAGQRMFLAIRDKAEACLKIAGSVQSQKLISVVSGDTWDMLACIDRLVELNYLCEITGRDVAGQDRVFVAGRAWDHD